MNIDLIVVYPGDCLARLNLDIATEGYRANDWEVQSATLVKLAPCDFPSKRSRETWIVDWPALPELNISLDPAEISDQYSSQIAEGLREPSETAKLDYGDYLYEQEKDRKLGL